MEECTIASKIVTGKLTGKTPLRRPRRRPTWDDNIIMVLKDIYVNTRK